MGTVAFMDAVRCWINRIFCLPDMESCDRKMKHSDGRWIVELDLPDDADVLVKGEDLNSSKRYILELEKQLQKGVEFTDRALKLCQDLKEENTDLKQTLLEMMQQIGH